MSNSKQYCERMAQNIVRTTKHSIPDIIRQFNPKSILDVGCADGKFTEYLSELLPKTIDITAIDTYIRKYRGGGWAENSGNITFRASTFNEEYPSLFPERYDCVLFSSVMHEISSYCENEDDRYSKTPIKNALISASQVLNKNGIVIVRDMLRPSRFQSKNVAVEFKDIETIKYFFKYLSVCPYFKAKYDSCPASKFMAYDSKDRFLFNVRKDVLMEFLMTYTWGAESFDREVQEKKFIMEKNDWEKAFAKAGFTIFSYLSTNEQYPEYFNRLVNVQEGFDYPPTTCLIVAQKKG